MKITGPFVTTAILAATLIAPSLAGAQTVREGQPGGFDLLMFDPHVTKDWSTLETMVDSAYGSRYEFFPDRSSYVAARSSINDQAIRMDGEDRTLITAQGLGVPNDLQSALQSYYPTMTPEHLIDFDDGLTVVAIKYEDGETFVSVALMRDHGSASSASQQSGSGAANLGGPILEMTDTLSLGLPQDSRIISNMTHGPAGGPQMIVATAQVPLSVEDALNLVETALADKGHEVISMEVGGQTTLSIDTGDVQSAFTVNGLADTAEGSIISSITNVAN
ncbi:MAG: hypothetical protein ACU0BB_04705 [Paracoccaceae bacterium]